MATATQTMTLEKTASKEEPQMLKTTNSQDDGQALDIESLAGLTADERRKMQEAWVHILRLCGMDIPKDTVPDLTQHLRSELSDKSPEGFRERLWSYVLADHPDASVLRFMRARKWDVKAAMTMFVSALNWRGERKIDDDTIRKGESVGLEEKRTVDEDGFMSQYRSGKSFVRGVDKENRPCYVVRVKLHDPKAQSGESMESYVLHNIESIKMMLTFPNDKACLIFDLTGFGLKNMDFHVVKFLVTVFEARYPETLGLVLVHKAPFVFWGIWSIIKGWLDPVIASKINFTSSTKDLLKFIDKDLIDLLPALWFLHLDRRERKVGPLEPMAELLAQRCFLSSSSGHACLSRSREQRKSPAFVALRSSGFHGRTLALGAPRGKLLRGRVSSVPVQMTPSIGKSLKWWEKGLQANMKEIESAQDLVDSLLNAGDKLVIVDFFSSGCGGCRALHPKICQFAEKNPNVLFLQINYEKLKSMCYSLHVHVLPFFRFYRGAHGRLGSFSCTNATIKKFKDALAKHSTDRCSLGPAKGLEESELLALAANTDLSFNYAKMPSLFPSPDDVAERARASPKFPVLATLSDTQDSEDKAMVIAGR